MVREVPPFLEGRQWALRLSRSKAVSRHVYYVVDEPRYEYEREPRRDRLTWHQIDWRHNLYRDIDPDSGLPVAGREGEWRPLR